MGQELDEKVYPHAVRSRVTLFMSGMWTGISSIFLMLRLLAPPQLHMTFNIMLGVGVLIAFLFYRMSAFHNRQILEISLEAEKEKEDG